MGRIMVAVRFSITKLVEGRPLGHKIQNPARLLVEPPFVSWDAGGSLCAGRDETRTPIVYTETCQS